MSRGHYQAAPRSVSTRSSDVARPVALPAQSGRLIAREEQLTVRVRYLHLVEPAAGESARLSRGSQMERVVRSVQIDDLEL